METAPALEGRTLEWMRRRGFRVPGMRRYSFQAPATQEGGGESAPGSAPAAVERRVPVEAHQGGAQALPGGAEGKVGCAQGEGYP